MFKQQQATTKTSALLMTSQVDSNMDLILWGKGVILPLNKETNNTVVIWRIFFQDQDTSDEDDVLDHDDPPYQAPPIIEAVVEDSSESSDTSDEDDDLEADRAASSASESTRLSSTGWFFNELMHNCYLASKLLF